MVGLYALVGRMRLVSSPAVVAAADQIILGIIATYQGPKGSPRNYCVREVVG